MGRKPAPIDTRNQFAHAVAYSAVIPNEPFTGTPSIGIGNILGLDYSQQGAPLARSTAYDSMDIWFREYKRHSVVRACINAKAAWTTAKGFSTSLDWANPDDHTGEEVSEFPGAKETLDFVNRENRRFNLDQLLYNSMISVQISGLAGWLIIRDLKTLFPLQLVELTPWNLFPRVKEDTGELDYWDYTGLPDISTTIGEGHIPPAELLSFTNSELFNEYVGLSDVEPIVDAIEAHRYIVSDGYKEAVKSNWAPFVFLRIDTGTADDTTSKAIIKAVVDQSIVAPGKVIGINRDVEVITVDINPKFAGLSKVKEDLDREIIGNFLVPKFMINREAQVNRATAFAEAQAFVNGEVANKQRMLKRQIEARWYAQLVLVYQMNKKMIKEGEHPEIVVKHNWDPITIADLQEIIDSVAKLAPTGVVSNAWIRGKLLQIDPEEEKRLEEQDKQVLVDREVTLEQAARTYNAQADEAAQRREINAKTLKVLDKMERQ